jgi:hypothetical protein
MEKERPPLAEWVDDWSLSLATGAVSTQTRAVYLRGLSSSPASS